MTGIITFHRFVRHNAVPEFEAAGWTLEPTNLGPTHGAWSVLMTWAGEGEPPAHDRAEHASRLILEAAE